MFVELLRPEWGLPNGANYNLMRLRLLPVPGRAGELLRNESRFIGRLITKGGGFTHVNTATAPSNHFGAAEGGLEAGAGLNLENAAVQSGSVTPLYPFLRLRCEGTIADDDTTARLVLCCAAPLYGIEVLEARDGLPFKAGDDLLRSDLGMPSLVISA